MALSSQVDRYAFNIVENGTSVNEQIEVDVENQTEVIRVPQHNNVDAVEIINDFDAVSHEFYQQIRSMNLSLCKDEIPNYVPPSLVSKINHYMQP